MRIGSDITYDVWCLADTPSAIPRLPPSPSLSLSSTLEFRAPYIDAPAVLNLALPQKPTRACINTDAYTRA